MFKRQNPEKMVLPIKCQINLCLQAQRKKTRSVFFLFFFLHCNSFILNLISLLSYIFPIKEDIRTTKGYNLNPGSHFQTTKKRREKNEMSGIQFHQSHTKLSFWFYSIFLPLWSLVCCLCSINTKNSLNKKLTN